VLAVARRLAEQGELLAQRPARPLDILRVSHERAPLLRSHWPGLSPNCRSPAETVAILPPSDDLGRCRQDTQGGGNARCREAADRRPAATPPLTDRNP
jgi:hypothetical protein